MKHILFWKKVASHPKEMRAGLQCQDEYCWQESRETYICYLRQSLIHSLAVLNPGCALDVHLVS